MTGSSRDKAAACADDRLLPILLVAAWRRRARRRHASRRPAAVFTQYCVTCHNATAEDRGAGHRSRRARATSAAKRRSCGRRSSASCARARCRRPARRGRIRRPTSRVATFLETELDRAAAAKPNPGSTAAAPSSEPHRVSERRPRSARARRAAARRWTISLLLPADNISSGFDNIADLLFVSPTTMERYLDAAQKDQPPRGRRSRTCRRWSTSTGCIRNSGRTRGWTSCRSARAAAWRSAATSRSTATTIVKLDVAGAAPRSAPDRDHRGRRTGAADHGRRHCRRGAAAGRAGAAAPPAGVPHPGEGRAAARRRHLHRAQPGARRRDAAAADARPGARSRRSPASTISGPYNVNGPGDTPSRRRIFVCRPGRASGRRRRRQLACADADSLDAGAAGVPASGDRRRRRAPAAVLHRRPGRRRIRSRHSAGARTGAGEPAVPVPHRAGAGERRARHALSRQRSRAGVAPVVLSLEQHSGRRTAGRRDRRAAEEPGGARAAGRGACSPIRVPNRW